MDALIKFTKKHTHILILLFLSGIFLFYKLGNHPLIDVDETRYVSMARGMFQSHDWLTLYLNGATFFEKPPMYFWTLATSFLGFGNVSEFTARFPVALAAMFGVFFTYFLGKKVVSKEYGFVSASILISAMGFLVFAKLATLDMMLSIYIMASIWSGFLTFFCSEKNKKYFWWLAYFFSAMAFLTKGLPGFVLPAGVLFFCSLAVGKLKELFKPINILPGILLFLAVAMPWHIEMYKEHGTAFINEYVIKHHLARFMNSEGLGRKEPFYFFILVFLVGFLPWTASFIASVVKKIKKFKSFFAPQTNEQRLYLFNFIYFAFGFLFFSASSTKLVPYLLPVFPAAAMMTGHYWNQYIFKGKNLNGIKISTIITSVLFIILGTVLLFVSKIVKPDVYSSISHFSRQFAAVLIGIPSLTLIFLALNKRKHVFISHIVFMIFFIIIAVNNVFTVVYTGSGENELIEYSEYAKGYNNSELVTFDFGVRPSTWYYYGKHVYFITDQNFERLKDVVNMKKPVFVIVKNSNMEQYPEKLKTLGLESIKTGKKYSLFKTKSTKEEIYPLYH